MSETVSETPRTDAEAVEGMGNEKNYPEWHDSVDASFASQLEKELAAKKRELAEARANVGEQP